MRAVLSVFSFAFAAGLPLVHLPDILGDGCTGTKPPQKKVPACYTGKASVMGGAFSEGVLVTISEFDYKSEKGKIDIHATGVSPWDCKAIPFTKSGQKIEWDTSCLSGTKVDTEYCSDQDKIMLHVAIPHFPIASIPVTLNSVDCP